MVVDDNEIPDEYDISGIPHKTVIHEKIVTHNGSDVVLTNAIFSTRKLVRKKPQPT